MVLQTTLFRRALLQTSTQLLKLTNYSKNRDDEVAAAPSSLLSANPRARRLCGLTFELRGRQRWDARPGLQKMYRVPASRAWWPAVGAPFERGVRPQWEDAWHRRDSRLYGDPCERRQARSLGTRALHRSEVRGDCPPTVIATRLLRHALLQVLHG